MRTIEESYRGLLVHNVPDWLQVTLHGSEVPFLERPADTHADSFRIDGSMPAALSASYTPGYEYSSRP